MKRSFLLASFVVAVLAATPFRHAFGSVEDLNAAFENGNTARILELLMADPRLLKSNLGDGMTPLHSGAYHGYEQVVDFALENGLSFDLKDRQGLTPVWYSVAGGRPAMLRKLIALGADLSVRDSDGLSLLHQAILTGRLEIIRILLDSGAGVDEPDRWRMRPVDIASSSNNVELLKLLLEKGATLSGSELRGLTPLHFACLAGSTAVRYLLDHGSRVDPRDADGKTPLLTAVNGNNLDASRALILKGADINAADDKGDTPLRLAILKGSKDFVSLLAHEGAKLDAVDVRTGRTALQEASLRGYSGVVELLLSRGADKNAKDKDGRTALSYALKYGNKAAADVLRKTGVPEVPWQTNLDDSAELGKALGRGEATIWYLKHSGWAIKTRSAFLVFDYWDVDPAPDAKLLANGHVRPEELRDLPVYVFVSHRHPDHFAPEVLGWKREIPNLTCVFGFEPPNGEGIIVVGPRQQKTIGPLRITAIKANDAGVGFAVEVDGLTIFHAGDHSNVTLETTGNTFFPEIDFLAGNGIRPDIAFFLNAFGCGDGGKPETYERGIFYAVDKLEIKACLPMHAADKEWTYLDLVDAAVKNDARLQVGAAAGPGDRFFFSKGKLTN